jgi:hypothetical protein
MGARVLARTKHTSTSTAMMVRDGGGEGFSVAVARASLWRWRGLLRGVGDGHRDGKP